MLIGGMQRLVERGAKYNMGSFLGSGTHGTVHKATIDGTDVAVKILGEKSWEVEEMRTMQEVYIMERRLDHPVHAVRILDIFLDKNLPQVHLVMELWGLSGDDYRISKRYGRGCNCCWSGMASHVLATECCGVVLAHIGAWTRGLLIRFGFLEPFSWLWLVSCTANCTASRVP